MRRFAIVLLAVLLAVGIHVDYHLARPLHHRLSLDWQQHWVFAALLFAGVASLVARRWAPPERWRAGAWILVLGLLLAQVVEPVLTLGFYERRLAYEVEPELWTAFVECLAAGLPVYALLLWRLRGRVSAAGVRA
jgi:hypothetical protein